MRGEQRKHPLVLLRQLLRAVTVGAYTSSSAAASTAYYFSSSSSTTTTSRPISSFFSRSLWSWSGPGCVEGRGLTKPQAFRWDGSLKISGGGSGSSSSLWHTRGAKINGSEVKPGFIIMRKGQRLCPSPH